jgi:hypothetical protein
MYPFQFYTNICSLLFLTTLFHYPLQYINLENKYFERYSVNLMRSVSCFMIFTESLDILITHGFQNHCTSLQLQENIDLFYFFLAYIYYDIVLLMYQHYLGLEKKLRYDLLLHHLLALFSLTFIQNYELYSFVPYICLSEGISIVSGVKLLANIFKHNVIAKYCINYRLYFLTYFRMALLWPFIAYQFYNQIENSTCNQEIFNYENLGYVMMAIMMIYSAEYLWYMRGSSELKMLSKNL